MLNRDQKECIRDLCEYLTQDVENLWNKNWLKDALKSHVSRLTGLNESLVADEIRAWWPAKPVKKR